MKEVCIVAGLEHEWEFVVAAFGQQVFQCKLCKMFWDENEEGSV